MRNRAGGPAIAGGMQLEPQAKLKIVALEPSEFQVIEAQFNPKEVQVDASVPWQKHKERTSVGALEYAGREGRTVSLELMFDASETKKGSVGIRLRDLEAMMENIGEREAEKRPPRLRILWGDLDRTECDMPDFDVVLESMSVKRTMFATDGRCLRAIVTCKFKEAGKLSRASGR